jgi:sarcosine oxidase, subunit alpha
MATDLRIEKHPYFSHPRPDGRRVCITVDGRPLEALEGESLAAALWAGGHIAIHHDSDSNTFRGMYCGIGHCYECRVTVDGVPDVRSCLVQVRDGMCVSLHTVAQRDEADGCV